MSARGWSLWVLIGVATTTFVGANLHLVYVAITSQPDCVGHLKATGGRPGEYMAAKSAC